MDGRSDDRAAIDAEIAAAQHEAGLFDLAGDGTIAVTGPDRVAYLNGLLTSDVAALPEGGAQPSAMVSAMGKLLADFVLVNRDGEILLETTPERHAMAAATLAKFLIADDAEIADRSAAWSIFSLQGPLAGHIVEHACPEIGAAPGAPFALREARAPEGPLLVMRNDRFGLPGYDVWVAAAGGAALRARTLACGREHGLRACGGAAREALRVAAGRPAWGREIDEQTFPGEVGLERVVSYSKGCFMGQEVLARIRNLGHVNRVLARVRLDRLPEAPLPIALFLDGAESGRLTSVARVPDEPLPVGLAMLRRATAAPGAAYDARPPGGAPIRVIVRDIVS